jgi:hypothetical protein
MTKEKKRLVENNAILWKEKIYPNAELALEDVKKYLSEMKTKSFVDWRRNIP